jgi:hypothetical protein
VIAAAIAASALAQPYGPPRERLYRCDGDRDWGGEEIRGLSLARLNERIEMDFRNGVFNHKHEHKLHDRMKKLHQVEERYCAKGYITPEEYRDLRERLRQVHIAIERAEHHQNWEGDFDRY